MTPISNVSAPAPTPARIEKVPPAPIAAPSNVPEVNAPIAEAGATGHILIARIGQHADLAAASQLPRGAERKTAVYNALVETARTSQVDALAALAKLQSTGDVTKVESMFLPNAILVTAKAGADDAVSQALKGLANVQDVVENHTWNVRADEFSGAAGAAAGAAYVDWAKGYIDGPKWHMAHADLRADPDTPAPPTLPTANPKGADDGWETDVEEPGAAVGDHTWGIDKIHAPEVWAEGVTGQGVTVGVVDTGLDSQHPAIKAHYRGTNADGSQSNDYNWYDPFTLKATPFDDGDHGTHVAGTSVGGADGRVIGVAPGAKVIAAKAINGSGYNTSETTLKALQWMLAPTKTDGTAPDPTKGADVINNSWGGSNPDEQFMETFAALKAAGIELVNSAGNEGPGAGTTGSPGSYPGYFSIAASTVKDTIAGFSSRGPSKYAKDGEMIPNIAAPGANVLSSVPGGRYQAMSGTSMAAPHTTGAVALLLSKFPQATHEQLAKALESTAQDIDIKGPDTAAGYGRIDVAAALRALGASMAGASDAQAGAAAAAHAPVEMQASVEQAA
ncbi:MAG: S8 family serine peptidase [Thermoleophilia bacterium]|nr:S8 family serine peptidase [Thermoleophilia bacterium]